MGSDWYAPRDRGPTAEEFQNEWQARPPKKKVRKMFVIESRYIGPMRTRAYGKLFTRGWGIHRRYRTAASRDEALSTLQSRKDAWHTKWEYRKGGDE